MGRIIAIDYGSKRIGLAVTDPLKIIASALDTVPSHEALSYLVSYVAAEQVEAFVIGMPKGLDGMDTDATQPTQAFIKRLHGRFPNLTVHQVDERFTSKVAEQAMLMGGMRKKKRRQKGEVDKISAVLILQSYLEMNP